MRIKATPRVVREILLGKIQPKYGDRGFKNIPGFACASQLKLSRDRVERMLHLLTARDIIREEAVVESRTTEAGQSFDDVSMRFIRGTCFEQAASTSFTLSMRFFTDGSERKAKARRVKVLPAKRSIVSSAPASATVTEWSFDDDRQAELRESLLQLLGDICPYDIDAIVAARPGSVAQFSAIVGSKRAELCQARAGSTILKFRCEAWTTRQELQQRTSPSGQSTSGQQWRCSLPSSVSSSDRCRDFASLKLKR